MLDPSLCPFCFSLIGRRFPCRQCGYRPGKTDEAQALALGIVLSGRYVVGGVIGQGGFGATYRGYDGRLASVVAIKEYFPYGSARRNTDGVSISVSGSNRETFDYGCGKFLEEARTLAKLRGAQRVVSVFDYFKENNTAYIIMEFLSGLTLGQLQAQQPEKRLSPETALPIFIDILSTLSEIHSQQILHRDISPGNILVDDKGSIKLLDFGAARQALSSKDQRMTVILKPGYAPFEQYSDGAHQGPWSDIYAAGATFYAVLSGIKPVDSLKRLMDDTLQPLSALGVTLPPRVEQAIMKALAVQPANRWQTAAEFAEELRSGAGRAAPRPGHTAESGQAGTGRAAPAAKIDDRVGQPISGAEFRKSLEKHTKFLTGKPNGQRLNLSMRSLAGMRIGAVNLSRAELTGTSFMGCQLSGANFTDANLFCADFTGADLSDAKFDQADLRGARFEDAALDGASFEGADCRDGVMLVQHEDGHLQDIKSDAPKRETSVTNRGADRRQANVPSPVAVKGTGLKRTGLTTDLTEADIGPQPVGPDAAHVLKPGRPIADLEKTTRATLAAHQSWLESGGRSGRRLVQPNGDLSRVQAIKIDWSWAEFSFVNMMDINLQGAKLSMADFSTSVLDHATFADTEAQGAKFRFCNIQNADFSRANLSVFVAPDGQKSSATFVKSDLRGATFEASDCQGADFRGADLRNTSFENAVLSDADFTDAVLEGADFTGAVLDRTIGLA